MSLDNPTLLRVGMSGRIDDRRHVVRCRVTLSVQDRGETYFWNEFYLDDEQGGQLVLSHEEDDAGLVWRLFSIFTPREPLTAGAAAARRMGDRIEFTNPPMRVTFAGESRVRQIEGTAPEGVEVGDTARFFNAEDGPRMLVVSWTGDEVEHYLGTTVPARRVAEAFGLPWMNERSAPRSSAAGSSAGSKLPAIMLGVWAGLILIVGALVFFGRNNGHSGAARPEPTPITAAAPTRLQPGARARIADGADEEFRVAARARVEVGQLRRRFVRHEYLLGGGHHDDGLLLHWMKGGTEQWVLLKLIPPPPGSRAMSLAGYRQGQLIQFSGQTYRVSFVEHARVVQRDGGASVHHWSDEPIYGLVAQREGDWLLLRWDREHLWCYRGWSVKPPTTIPEIQWR